MTAAIITGGRDYAFTQDDIEWLNWLHTDHEFTLIIEGGCRRKDYRGDDLPTADYCGYQWARSQGIQTATMDANWPKHAKGAGPIRNSMMARMGKQLNAIVIAFPGGHGTADMTAKAETLGLRVIRP